MLTHFVIINILLLLSHSDGVKISYNINDECSELVSKTEFKALFTSTASIRPYEDVTITEVVEENTLLWEPEKEGDECTFMVIFRFEELVTLVCLKISTESKNYKLHFVKENGQWEMLEDQDFAEILNDMRSKIPSDKHILLDIKNPDEEKVRVCRRNTGGADFVTFTTNYPYHTIKIVDDKSVIWRGKYNEDSCIDCAVYLKNESFELFQAFLCSEEKVGFRFFMKVEDRWATVKEEEFYKNLKSLDIEEDDRRGNKSKEGVCDP